MGYWVQEKKRNKWVIKYRKRKEKIIGQEKFMNVKCMNVKIGI